MKIIVDRNLCDSNALCIREAPQLLALDESEELQILRAELQESDMESARRAVAICPKAALHLSE